METFDHNKLSSIFKLEIASSSKNDKELIQNTTDVLINLATSIICCFDHDDKVKIASEFMDELKSLVIKSVSKK